MTVLEYASVSRRRSTWWTLLAIVLVGGLLGVGIGAIAYDPLLDLLARGTHLYDSGDSSVSDHFIVFIKFLIASCVAGMLVGYAAWLKEFTGRFFHESVVFHALFIAGSGGGLAYAYASWNPVGHFATRLTDASMMPAPVAGCALVSLGIALSVRRRVAAARPVAEPTAAVEHPASR